MIPKFIHQIWLRGGALPEQLQANVDLLKASNPDWEHIVWSGQDAEAFVARSYGPEMLRRYSQINRAYGAPRSDMLRHLILGRFGGVYFDIKSGANKPLSETLRDDDEYVIAQWPEGHPCSFPHRELAHVSGGEFVTWFFGCRPNHPFALEMIKRMLKNMASYGSFSPVGRSAALTVAGPIAYTLALHPLLDKHAHRIVSFDDQGLYYSIDGYDHSKVFPGHYSKLTMPLVKLSPLGTAISRTVNMLRGVKVTIAATGRRSRRIGR